MQALFGSPCPSAKEARARAQMSLKKQAMFEGGGVTAGRLSCPAVTARGGPRAAGSRVLPVVPANWARACV